LNILHVITTLDVGGAEMHLLAQVRGQSERGHHVRVAYLKGEGSLAPDFRTAGAEWVGLVGQGPTVLWKLRRHLGWCRIVHSHLLKADAVTAVAATLFGRRSRLISSKHNDERALQNPGFARAHRFLGNLPPLTIVLSDHVCRYFERYGGLRAERMRRIYYGLDPEPFERAVASDARAELRRELNLAPDDVVAVCVARFAPQKAHGVLLEALSRACAGQQPGEPRLRLLLVGDDPFGDGRSRVESKARELGLLENGDCLLLGIRRDVPRLLAASDLFVMSSRWEGLGLVFLEAMATGLPVLSTNVSAVPEVVLDGETGLLVPVDDPAALSAALLDLTRDSELRNRLGTAGRLRVAQVFSLPRMVQETLAVYSELSP